MQWRADCEKPAVPGSILSHIPQHQQHTHNQEKDCCKLKVLTNSDELICLGQLQQSHDSVTSINGEGDNACRTKGN